MKHHLLAFACLISVLFSSCDQSAFKQFDQDFTENRWAKTDVRSYDFDLEKDGSYDVYVDFSHVYGAQFPSIPIKMEIFLPDGSKSIEKFVVQIKNEKGEDAGDCNGDYCDLKQEVFKNRPLEAGKYKITLANEFDFDYFPNVIGLGIRVVDSKN